MYGYCYTAIVLHTTTFEGRKMCVSSVFRSTVIHNHHTEEKKKNLLFFQLFIFTYTCLLLCYSVHIELYRLFVLLLELSVFFFLCMFFDCISSERHIVEVAVIIISVLVFYSFSFYILSSTIYQ